ncbi:hypothetical protein Fmac_032674 [Flemingia macrophylla]|uniref:Uncharacterized protein n=1 Tax=Flemingia macrophylla TaxID=520843 RepID=A0ABD1L607_9FABA
MSGGERGKDVDLKLLVTIVEGQIKVFIVGVGFGSRLCVGKVVDAVQAVKMTNARGEVKYPIKAHGKSARDSFLMNGYALHAGCANQGMPLRVTHVKIACLDFNLYKTKMQLGV